MSSKAIIAVCFVSATITAALLPSRHPRGFILNLRPSFVLGERTSSTANFDNTYDSEKLSKLSTLQLEKVVEIAGLKSSADYFTMDDILVGLEYWKSSLLHGHLPESKETSLGFPDAILSEEICHLFTQLKLPKLTMRHEALVRPVLTALLDMALSYVKVVAEKETGKGDEENEEDVQGVEEGHEGEEAEGEGKGEEVGQGEEEGHGEEEGEGEGQGEGRGQEQVEKQKQGELRGQREGPGKGQWKGQGEGKRESQGAGREQGQEEGTNENEDARRGDKGMTQVGHRERDGSNDTTIDEVVLQDLLKGNARGEKRPTPISAAERRFRENLAKQLVNQFAAAWAPKLEDLEMLDEKYGSDHDIVPGEVDRYCTVFFSVVNWTN